MEEGWYFFIFPPKRETWTKIWSIILAQKHVIFFSLSKNASQLPLSHSQTNLIVMSGNRKPFLSDILLPLLGWVLRMAWNSQWEMEMPPRLHKDRVSSLMQWVQKRKTLEPHCELHRAACPVVALQHAVTNDEFHFLLHTRCLVTDFRISLCESWSIPRYLSYCRSIKSPGV